MGVWSPGLYGNDVTADLKSDFREFVRLPIGADELVERLTNRFGDVLKADDESATSFRLALADLLHTYGFDAPLVYSRALDIIASGADLEAHRQLGMSERDLRQRQRELHKLGAKIARPNSKPRNRRVLAEPEAWQFEEGALIVYPTNHNGPINPYFTERLMLDGVADGWGGFVVLGRDRIHGFFAVYLIAVLAPLGPSQPDLRTVVAQGHLDCVPALVTVPRLHPRKMRLKLLGQVKVKQSAVEAHFVPGTPPFDFAPQVLANSLFLHVSTYPSAHRLNLKKFVDLRTVV